jgi:spermidine/putrescine transport system ATP-binding protein
MPSPARHAECLVLESVMPLLQLKNVTRRFGQMVAVNNVSLSIEAGEFVTLLGPSWCGKTTILRMIAGFDLPDAGQILLDGKDLADTPPEKRPLHTVFQNYALFPHMTVSENILFPLKMAHRPQRESQKRLRDVLLQVHLTDKASAYPHELSGGQKQRVALARGLVNQPRLLLLDEPLAALDAKLREEMQIELINLQRDVGVTFVFVTHAQDEALALSHRIAVMQKGSVAQVDEPSKLYGLPKNRFVADFIGHINLLEAQVFEAAHGHSRLSIVGLGDIVALPHTSLVVGSKGIFAIRPEQVRLGTRSEIGELKNNFTGKVKNFLYRGDVTVYKVQLENGLLIEALLPNSAPGKAELYEVGDSVLVGWRQDAGVFLLE